MKAHYHREQFPEDGVKYQVRFSLFKDEAALCLDTSGEGLYKRGYRAVGVEAPLRETLAAAHGHCCPATGAKTPSATPSAAAAPFPSRRR